MWQGVSLELWRRHRTHSWTGGRSQGSEWCWRV